MRIVIFCHSLVSDWNHGNAHFLRGVCAELNERGHEVHVLEPAGGWSRSKLVRDQGEEPLRDFARAFPSLSSNEYELDRLDLDHELDGADVVLVHEWNEPELVRRVGEHRARTRSYRLLFHDTHHRAVTAPEQMERFELSGYDGVLAFGEVIRRIYVERGWVARAWTWHEAADTRTFRPLEGETKEGDLVWIGNWGDEERSRELHELLFEPARRTRLSGTVYGVRYPPDARLRIRLSGLRYRGWLANHLAPRAFARHRLTVHVPRGPYVRKLPGIPTIRPFEALACGIPLICAPWDDAEGLFEPGDYLVARDGAEMESQMRAVIADPALADELRRRGLETIHARHTCAHRVDELLAIRSALESEREGAETVP